MSRERGWISFPALQEEGNRAILPPLEALPHISAARRRDGHLWVIALLVSLALNGVVIVLLALHVIQSILWTPKDLPPPVPQEEPVMIVIVPENLAPVPSPVPPEEVVEKKPEFARTSEDQRGRRPDKPAFVGERDTQATSDTTPDASAPDMPAQAGIEPRHEREVETTEGNFQEGPGESAPPPPPPASAATPTPPAADRGEVVETAGKEDELVKPASPAARDLAETVNPVDVPVPPRLPDLDDMPVEEKLPEKGDAKEMVETEADTKPAEEESLPKPRVPVQDPAFRSEQRKTAIRGSISRTGRSALDVADTPLGRYQAALSKAVEIEWRRNCVRHRDFITPGFLTVRFYVEPTGKVRSVQFVGQMETGEVQKGFTLSSIRDAAIPPMPPAVRKELDGEPLELIFNFYF